MITPQDVQFIKDPVTQAKTIVIAMGVNANYDIVASALSLYLSLKNAGKSVYIVCAAPMRVEFSYLVGVDEVKEKLGNKSLMISFDYSEDAVEKVSYSITEDGKKFQLLVSPKAGGRPLDPSTVQYSGSGAQADLLFIFGASSFEDLGPIYEADKYFFESVFSVSLNVFQGQQFTRVALDSSGQTCLAEGVAVLLNAMGVAPIDDIATNILSSIEQATHRFQSFGMNPETFELIAQLMRGGARRSSASVIGGDGGGTPPVYSAGTAQNGQQYVSNIPPMYNAQGNGMNSVPAYSSDQATQESATQSLYKQPLNVQLQPQSQYQLQPQPQVQNQPATQTVPPAIQVSTSSFAQALRAKNSGAKMSGGNGIAQDMPIVQQPAQQIFQIQHENGVVAQPFQSSAQQVQTQNPPQEWMQPKVFTGSTKV